MVCFVAHRHSVIFNFAIARSFACRVFCAFIFVAINLQSVSNNLPSFLIWF
jgi:hypothetical protein